MPLQIWPHICGRWHYWSAPAGLLPCCAMDARAEANAPPRCTPRQLHRHGRATARLRQPRCSPRSNASEQKRMSSRQYTDGGSRRSVERGKVCLLQSIASVCLLLRHFIHVTDNFCHLSVLFRRQSRGARSCGAGLSLSSLLSPVSSLFYSLCSHLSSPLLSLPSPRVPLGSPRLSPVYCLMFALLSPCPSPLSALPLSLFSVFSLSSASPRSSRNCACCSSLIVLISTTFFVKESIAKLTHVLRSGPAGLATALRP